MICTFSCTWVGDPNAGVLARCARAVRFSETYENAMWCMGDWCCCDLSDGLLRFVDKLRWHVRVSRLGGCCTILISAGRIIAHVVCLQ